MIILALERNLKVTTRSQRGRGREQGVDMPEYIMTVSIEYGTNIEADSAEQARDKARNLINEANVNWLCDIADITIEGE